MARGRKKKQRVERVIKIKRSEIREFFSEQSRLKDQQASYTGTAGRDARTFKDRTGLSPIALGFIGKLDRLGDDLKRQSTMDEVIFLFDAMGWNDQGNLFDRATTKIENDLVDDEEEPAETPTEGLKQDGLPLDEAKQKFEAAAKANPPKPVAGDALTALAGAESTTVQ
ncbi:hypothetical protein [Labrys neptuniae]